AGRLTLDVRKSRRSPTTAVPHVLARMVEATCAYHRQYYKEPITYPLYAKIHNLLSQNPSAFDLHALRTDRDINLWAQRQFRLQLTLQYQADQLELARVESILRAIRPLAQLREAFRRHMNVDLDFYTAYSYLIYSHITQTELPGFRTD